MQPAKQTVEGVGGAAVQYEAETVLVTVSPINTGIGRNTVDLEGVVNIQSNASTTTTTIRVRREGLTGTQVLSIKIKPGASAELSVPIQVTDTPPGEVGGASYVITAQETAAVKGTSVESRLAATY